MQHHLSALSNDAINATAYRLMVIGSYESTLSSIDESYDALVGTSGGGKAALCLEGPNSYHLFGLPKSPHLNEHPGSCSFSGRDIGALAVQDPRCEELHHFWLVLRKDLLEDA